MKRWDCDRIEHTIADLEAFLEFHPEFKTNTLLHFSVVRLKQMRDEYRGKGKGDEAGKGTTPKRTEGCP